MPNLTSTKEKRDFLAREICKRIIGPGFAQEVYVCNSDASNEILSERPNRVYTAGFLSPASKSEKSGDSLLGTSEDGIVETDIPFSEENMLPDPYASTLAIQEESPEEDSLSSKEDEVLDEHSRSDEDNSEDKESERADFAPSHMGLITCVGKDCLSVNIQTTYGVYNLIRDVEKEVKIPWGRCTQEQIESAFREYDEYAKTLLFCIGKKSMTDVFSIDYQNKTISPKGIFTFTDEKGSGRKYLRASQFPDLLHNRIVNAVCSLLYNPEKEYDLKVPIIKEEDFRNELEQIINTDSIKLIISTNSLTDILSRISYDEHTQMVRIVLSSQNLTLPDKEELRSSLLLNNPVRDYLLPRLLKTHFFKREQKCDVGTIDISNGSRGIVDDFSENVQLRWKTFVSAKSPDKKYLRVLAVNKNTKGLTESDDDDAMGGRVVTAPSKWLYQFRLKVLSTSFVSYTEPHVSTIDEEFQLNEKLYAGEKMYGKGVNCALTWEYADSEDETKAIPTWVETTCNPLQKVRSFSTQLKDDGSSIDHILDVYELSYFSNKTNETIIQELRALSDSYHRWHIAQTNIAGTDAILAKVISEQEEFINRFCDNIDYLAENKRAMRCFRIANAAMYIQMLLTKDEYFRNKYRALDDYSDVFDYGSNNQELLRYFKEKHSIIIPKYRPFQLAFLVMNVKSTFENSDPYRNENVDLIWFPTGGGKTEAYLALTALTIAERRTSEEQDMSGVSVIMRYTLRMLTSQQFQRASYLITALEFLRSADPTLGLGDDSMPITLGLWIGGGVTPNKLDDLTKTPYREYFDKVRANEFPENIPFPVSSCPWCGCRLTQLSASTNRILCGYDNRSGITSCLNHTCAFNGNLPIYYIDENLYKNPPTLLFATVDKFAQISTSGADKLFGVGTCRRKPDLIIQDELHLISGPLGSMVGMFESIIEELCSQKNGDVYIRRPKIIASTATTRNTSHLVRELYNRQVQTFPVSGVSYDDNFFSYAQPLKDSKRLYMGMAPTAHTAAELEIRTIAAELIAKEILIREQLRKLGINLSDARTVLNTLESESGELKTDYDNYWTIVSYYINKQSLGKTCSRIGQEVRENVNNMRDFIDSYASLDPLLRNFENRTTELTARQDSAKIKQLLVEAENHTKLSPTSSSFRVTSNMDIVLATNMISVGIDIPRWNIMNMIGQPLTTAEYIQSSSRVGRTHDGLVVSLYNPLRTRELSYYENYISYHQIFYKYVEPLSVTSFTEMTFQKLLCNLFAAYMLLIKGRNNIGDIQPSDIEELKAFIDQRSNSINPVSNAAFRPNMETLVNRIFEKYFDASKKPALKGVHIRTYLFGDRGTTYPKDAEFLKMGSLRDVESNTYILYE